MYLKEVNIIKFIMNIKMEFNIKFKLIIVFKVLFMDIYELILKLLWLVKLNGFWVEKIDF